MHGEGLIRETLNSKVTDVFIHLFQLLRESFVFLVQNREVLYLCKPVVRTKYTFYGFLIGVLNSIPEIL